MNRKLVTINYSTKESRRLKVLERRNEIRIVVGIILHIIAIFIPDSNPALSFLLYGAGAALVIPGIVDLI